MHLATHKGWILVTLRHNTHTAVHVFKYECSSIGGHLLIRIRCLHIPVLDYPAYTTLSKSDLHNNCNILPPDLG